VALGRKMTDRPRTRSIRWLIALSLVLAASAGGFLFRWKMLAAAGNYLVYSQTPRKADLILVLGGNFWGERVVEGAELARQGYAPVVLLSSPPYRGLPQGELSIPFLVQKGYREDNLQVFAHDANSTIAEANALRPELARRRVKRVILVTSSYHSRRAAVVFRLFCPGIEFISVAADDPQFHPGTWWEDDISRRLFYSEWEKIAGSVLIAYPTYLVRRAGRR